MTSFDAYFWYLRAKVPRSMASTAALARRKESGSGSGPISTRKIFSLGPGATNDSNPWLRSPSAKITAIPFSTAPICRYTAPTVGSAKIGASIFGSFLVGGMTGSGGNTVVVASITGVGAGTGAATTGGAGGSFTGFGAAPRPARYDTAENTTASTIATKSKLAICRRPRTISYSADGSAAWESGAASRSTSRLTSRSTRPNGSYFNRPCIRLYIGGGPGEQ